MPPPSVAADGSGSGQPHPHGFRTLAAFGDVDQHALAFAQRVDARTLQHRAWMNASLPPPSRTIKPNPFWALNHLTVPVSSTAAASRPGRAAPDRKSVV